MPGVNVEPIPHIKCDAEFAAGLNPCVRARQYACSFNVVFPAGPA